MNGKQLFNITENQLFTDNFSKQIEEKKVAKAQLDSKFKEIKTRLTSNTSLNEQNNQYDKAIAVYEVLLKNYPDSERLLTRMGNVQEAVGNKKAAKSYFDKAQEISKNGK